MMDDLKTSVSVVMTTYNGTRYLLEQLDSLRQQSLQPDEVLIADDCSSDGTYEMVSEYIKSHRLSSWHVFQNAKNLGWRRNFIEAIKKSRGDIVFLADQDDCWHPRKIELMGKAMVSNRHIEVLSCYKKDCATEGRIDVDEYLDEGFPETRELPLTNAILKVEGSPGCLYCVRRRFIDRVLPYWREELEHDSLFWRYSALVHGRFVLPKALVYWRTHADSAFEKERSRHHTREWRVDDIELSYAYLLDMERFCLTERGCSADALSTVRKSQKWCELRRAFIKNKSLTAGIRLFRYLDCYLSWKQIIRDWLFLLE